MMTLFSRFRNICMSIVVSVPSSFILKHFFVIVGQIVLPRSRLTFSLIRHIFSQVLVDKSLLLNSVDIHVVDWRKLWFLFNSLCLSAPVSLYTFHVPLIDNSDDILMIFQFIQIAKDPNITLIHQNLFLFGSNFTEKTHKEVDTTSIH